jgi:hypothetical protein
MRKMVLAALVAGTMFSGTAQAAATYTSLAAWQTDAGTYTNDVTYGAELSTISALTLDDGTDLSFGSSVQVRNVGSSWGTWSGGYSDDILYTQGGTSLTINFDTPVGGFGLFAEPNPFAVHQFTLTLSDGSVVGGAFDGNGGAGFLGFLGNGVVSATLTSTADFAIGDFYVTSGAVPEPATWAMMIGGFALVGASMRRRSTAVSFA